MRMLLAILVPWTLLTGCAMATEAKFREHLERRVGQDVNQLLSEAGPPVSDYAMPNGHRLLTYEYRGGSRTTFDRTFGVEGASTVPVGCRWTYEVSGTTVIAYRYRGNACRSR